MPDLDDSLVALSSFPRKRESRPQTLFQRQVNDLDPRFRGDDGRSLTRFLVQFFEKIKPSLRPKSKIMIACSGGPDSVALVYGLRALGPILPYEFFIGHINHALRGADSECDARFVRDLSRSVDFPFSTERCPIPRRSKGNLEEIARDKRYSALEKMAKKRGCTMILTAHTLDDQVETVLMNLMRGAGPDGLSGMDPVRNLESSQVKLGRPLLGVSKSELLGWLRRYKFHFRTDKSNRNRKLLRNWLRGTLVPLMEKKAPGFKLRAARLAAMARDEKEYWNRLVQSLEARLLSKYRGGQLLDSRGLLSYPPAVQRRFLRRALGRDLLTFDTIERLRHWMQSPPTGGRLFQLRKGWMAERLSKSKGSPSARLFWLKKTPAKKDKHLS